MTLTRGIALLVTVAAAGALVNASGTAGGLVTTPAPATVRLKAISARVSSKGASLVIEATEPVGAPASRVRIALAQPVVHRVRSDRNTIVVDFEKPSGKGVPYVLPPAAPAKGDAPDAMMALRQGSGQ